jgi:hypothetical protein
VISVRLSSIEYPNTYFVFSEAKGNTTLKIKFAGTGWLTATIPDGNYTTIPGDDSSIQSVVVAALKTEYLPLVGTQIPSDPLIEINISPTTGHVTIESTQSPKVPFSLDFQGGWFDKRSYDWGLGYNLGFPKKEYLTPSTEFTGNAIIDTIGSSYLFFQLDGIDPIQHYTPEKNVISAFAKLVVAGDKNSVIYDDGSTFATKEFRYQQPTDFFQVHPRIVDTYGELVDMNGKNYSFTLELEEVTNIGAYRQYRDSVLSKPGEWNATFAV